MITLEDLRTLKSQRDTLIREHAEKLASEGIEPGRVLVELAYLSNLSTNQIKRIIDGKEV